MKLLLLLFIPFTLASQSWFKKAFQSDIIGNFKFSLYNFTDAVIPYSGLDSWMVVKGALWLDNGKRIAPYVSILGSYMNYLPFEGREEIRVLFSWQRFVQRELGIQYYPFYLDGDDYTPDFGLRLFAQYAFRNYDDPNPVENQPYSDLIKSDFQVGADYYHDNIFNEEDIPWLIIAWGNLSYRKTNFNFERFNTLFFSANFKLGHKGAKKNDNRSIFFPYAVVETTMIPFCRECNWWENYLRPGGGFRWYPFAYNEQGDPSAEFFRRLHFYAEAFHQGIWPMGQAPSHVKDWDFRFGLGFSTPGFNRRKEDEAAQRQY